MKSILFFRIAIAGLLGVSALLYREVQDPYISLIAPIFFGVSAVLLALGLWVKLVAFLVFASTLALAFILNYSQAIAFPSNLHLFLPLLALVPALLLPWDRWTLEEKWNEARTVREVEKLREKQERILDKLRQGQKQ